ncbi:hypothetical protein GCM10023317_79520 [Actinopolymorpha pittospori]
MRPRGDGHTTGCGNYGNRLPKFVKRGDTEPSDNGCVAAWRLQHTEQRRTGDMTTHGGRDAEEGDRADPRP